MPHSPFLPLTHFRKKTQTCLFKHYLFTMPPSSTTTELLVESACATAALCKDQESCTCGNSYVDATTGRWVSGAEALAIRGSAKANESAIRRN
jgi:hypothetical protein